VPNVMGVLRAEIRRLARKETKQELGALKKQVTMLRRRLAEWNRRMQGVEARARQLVRTAGAPARGAGDDDEGGKQIRFSSAWVRAHRKKLGMSRQLYARLVGVSAQTIMGWEAGRTRPRRAALRTWRSIRGKGLRELRAMLGGGDGAAGGRGRRRAGRKARRKVARRVRGAARTRVRRARVVRTVRASRGRRVRAAKKK
jgi:Helix-turn-helix domain